MGKPDPCALDLAIAKVPVGEHQIVDKWDRLSGGARHGFLRLCEPWPAKLTMLSDR